LTPGQFGVYGIYRADQWLYVGMGDIRARLLDHLNGDIPCILANGATSYVAAVTANAVAEEKALQLELKPLCNQRIG
jgi:hypothetical protein